VLHEELLRRPKHKGNLNATWQATQALLLNASVLTVSAWVELATRLFDPAPRRAWVYNRESRCEFRSQSAVCRVWAIDNLFDRRYQNPVGFCSRASEYLRVSGRSCSCTPK